MNPEQNPRQCAACGEREPSFIHTVNKNNIYRRLCTDCLLKEHRDLFCPVCLTVFTAVPAPQASIICLNCPSITHLDCSLPPSSSSSSSSAAAASSFTCPPCSDPNFSFFPKSIALLNADQNGENVDDGDEPVLALESAKALVAASEIAVVFMNNAAAQLKKEAHKKILEAKDAKLKAKEALGTLQDLVKQKALENINPNKRKNSDR